MTFFKSYLDNEIEALQSGTSIRTLETSLSIASGPNPTMQMLIPSPTWLGQWSGNLGSIPYAQVAGNVARCRFRAPNDGGAPVTLNYIGLLVTNQDSTEVLFVATSAPIVLPAGADYYVTPAEFTDTYTMIGTDLSLGANSIDSAAGGVFSSWLEFDIAP